MQELVEGTGAMAHGVLHMRIDLAEGLVPAFGHENRIIAEPKPAARRKGEMAMDFALKDFDLAMRHGERQGADEFGRTVPRVLGQQFVFDPRHRLGKIFIWSRPARRMNAGFALQSIDPEPGIVGQGRMTAGIGGGAGLEFGIGGESPAGLLRLGKVLLAGADRLDAVRAQERLDLPHLAGIMAGDDQDAAAGQSHESACFCNSTSSAMPLRASRSNWAS
jgi:hypothetical protein